MSYFFLLLYLFCPTFSTSSTLLVFLFSLLLYSPHSYCSPLYLSFSFTFPINVCLSSSCQPSLSLHISASLLSYLLSLARLPSLLPLSFFLLLSIFLFSPHLSFPSVLPSFSCSFTFPPYDVSPILLLHLFLLFPLFSAFHVFLFSLPISSFSPLSMK